MEFFRALLRAASDQKDRSWTVDGQRSRWSVDDPRDSMDRSWTVFGSVIREPGGVRRIVSNRKGGRAFRLPLSMENRPELGPTRQRPTVCLILAIRPRRSLLDFPLIRAPSRVVAASPSQNTTLRTPLHVLAAPLFRWQTRWNGRPHA